jgi:hypothetical protein
MAENENLFCLFFNKREIQFSHTSRSKSGAGNLKTNEAVSVKYLRTVGCPKLSVEDY